MWECVLEREGETLEKRKYIGAEINGYRVRQMLSLIAESGLLERPHGAQPVNIPQSSPVLHVPLHIDRSLICH